MNALGGSITHGEALRQCVGVPLIFWGGRVCLAAGQLNGMGGGCMGMGVAASSLRQRLLQKTLGWGGGGGVKKLPVSLI